MKESEKEVQIENNMDVLSKQFVPRMSNVAHKLDGYLLF